MNLTSLEKISIKNSKNINEDMIQKYIADHPQVLGLGDLTTVRREKIQPSKGRLDIVLQDEDATRFEVEIQLGATDPSHIIRTIEYWDVERKRSPQFDHCAVIVAEEITGRFMNVISLFNGSIPLIAIQMSAYKNGDDVVLTFTKVLDRISLATQEEDALEPTDRNYWNNQSSAKVMKTVDDIFSALGLPAQKFELKYNKFYIGLSKDGYVRNFIEFHPKKTYLYFVFKGEANQETIEKIEKAGFEVKYASRWKQYEVRINSFEQFSKHKEMFLEQVKQAMEFYNITLDE